VNDIVTQLEGLQIQQAALIGRLVRLSESGNGQREFVVGDRVRIRNPRLLQANRGRIVKIGKTLITVEARNGTKIVRARKNLVRDE
jgi:hypothetical protein